MRSTESVALILTSLIRLPVLPVPERRPRDGVAPERGDLRLSVGVEGGGEVI